MKHTITHQTIYFKDGTHQSASIEPRNVENIQDEKRKIKEGCVDVDHVMFIYDTDKPYKK